MTLSFAGFSLLAFALLACPNLIRAEEGGNTTSGGGPQRLSDFDTSKTKVNVTSDSNLPPDQLREKQMKKMREAQEKAIKDAEKQAAKDKKKEERKAKEKEKKDEESGIAEPKALPRKNAKIVELQAPDKDHKTGKVEVIKNQSSSGSNLIEVGGSKPAQQRGKIAIIDEKAGETALSAGETKALDIKDPPGEKRGFFDKMFGLNKQPATPGIQSAKNGEEFKITTPKKGVASDPTKFLPAASDHHDTLSHKVREQMAIKRLESESKTKEKEEPADKSDKSEKNAEVVNVDPPAAKGAPEIEIETDSKDAAAKAEVADKPMTEAEIKAAMEQQYRAGLGSRDVVAREASYQYAAAEKRVDAIPYLVEELKQDNLLASYAVQCMGAIGKLTEDVEVMLVRNLASHRAEIRQVCAETLGRLKSRRAVQPIIESFKLEKSYQVRQAELDALGVIGERSACAFLKIVLEQKDEIETVKSCAALALARMGDPSGRAHLIRDLDSPMPALQVLGLMGLSQLHEPFIAGYLNKALESPYEEVWTTAVYAFPQIGPSQALPVLRMRLESANDTVRRRAALAMGFLGSDEAVSFIDRALRMGTTDERMMGCVLIGFLQHRDRIPLLIERLQDPNTNVRQAAAVALTRLDAKESLPAMTDAARGVRNMDLPPGLRGAGPDYMERLVILSCVRILRGEKEVVEIKTMPNKGDNAWPEVDQMLLSQQKELVKLYQLVDVIGADGRAIGAVLKGPDGKEIMFKEGEPVASGFKVRDIGMPMVGKDKTKLPPYVTLMRGDDRITLIAGKAPEEENLRKKEK